MILWVGLALIVAGIIFLVTADAVFGLGDAPGSDIATLVAMLALLIVIGGSILARYHGQGGKALIHIAIWLGIGAVLALIYRWREPISAAFGS